jgi:hypothetical protein
MAPHELAAAVLVEPAADELVLAGAELDALVLDEAVPDELDEQAARPKPAVRTRAAMPLVCTALIYMSPSTALPDALRLRLVVR